MFQKNGPAFNLSVFWMTKNAAVIGRSNIWDKFLVFAETCRKVASFGWIVKTSWQQINNHIWVGTNRVFLGQFFSCLKTGLRYRCAINVWSEWEKQKELKRYSWYYTNSPKIPVLLKYFISIHLHILSWNKSTHDRKSKLNNFSIIGWCVSENA